MRGKRPEVIDAFRQGGAVGQVAGGMAISCGPRPVERESIILRRATVAERGYFASSFEAAFVRTS
jgi:hypothetical protein